MWWEMCVAGVMCVIGAGVPNSAKFRGGCRFDKGGVTNF